MGAYVFNIKLKLKLAEVSTSVAASWQKCKDIDFDQKALQILPICTQTISDFDKYLHLVYNSNEY